MIILSPAKSLRKNFSQPKKYTQIRFPDQSAELNNLLQKKSSADLRSLMNISDKLADLNVQRNKDFHLPFDNKNTPIAIESFLGDAYRAMNTDDWTAHDFNYAQKNLRMLSGLYGLLRPLDLMHPYRLEMGTKLKNTKGSNLYKFWGTQITELLAADMAESGSKFLINLASKEYWEAVQPEMLGVPVYTVHFREWKNDNWTFISFNAKRARGLMSRYIIQHRIKSLRGIKQFDTEEYQFNKGLSTKTEWFFTRENG